ncbi:LRRC56 [Symbiodinium microadriaticum]|nr:LRRC56 [Symbiodinium microadriaticum]
MSARPPNLPVLPLRQDVLLSTTLFEEIENGLSEEFLQEYTGVQDLNEVTFLDLQVDAVGVGERVECLGELLPRLQQLRLSRSHICTIRDLGTSLLNLKVLWLCRCSLQDLGGITVLPVLEELYVSFNDVSDLSPLLSHEALQILDMEGNLVDDFEEIQSLEVVSTLRELDISLNPVRKQEAVTRERILEALPHLEVLDTIPRKAKAQLEVSDAELEPLSEEEAAEAAEAEEDMQRNDELCSVAALLQQVAAETAAPPADDSGDRALQELRRRAKASSAELAAPPAPLSAEKELPSSEISSAVAAFRESLLGTLGSACGNGAFGEPAARSTSKAAAESEEANPKADEPSEQDLVIESVKRAERPGPTSWTSRASTLRSSREASRRAGGFFPSKRAWGSSSGGSTTCASSALASSRSISFSARQVESEASDLTAGEDGLALAGTPLAAIRRRRKGAQERGEEADIRDLLRRFEAGVGQEETSQTACGPAPRPMTSDVRINPRRPLSASSPSSGLRSSPKRQSSKREICDGVLEMSPTSSQSMPKPKAFGSAEVLLISQS